MSTRPNFEQGMAARGRGRTTGELGLLDPRARPALTGAALDTEAYSLSFLRGSSEFQYAQSEEDFRVIHGLSGFDAFSISLWTKWDGATPANLMTFAQGTDVVTNGAWGMDWNTAASGIFYVNSRGTTTNRSIAPVPTGVWVHLVGTYNRFAGTTIRLFVNGDNSVAVNGTFGTAKVLEHGVPFELNRNLFRATLTTNYGEQKMKNVQLWQRQLTSGEVVTLYNGGTPLTAMTTGLVSGLRLWWDLGGSYQERQRFSPAHGYSDGAVPGVPREICLFDKSGNGFHGRIKSDSATTAQLPTYVQDAP